MNFRWNIAQAAEIRWWQRYLKNKEPETYLEWKRQYWTDFLVKAGVEVRPEYSALDMGCGPAGIFTILNCNKVVAVDPLLDRYAQELEHFNAKDYPNVNFHNQPLEDFVPTEKFDQVFCLNAINHVADLSLSFDQLVAAVKPGGQLLVSIDAHNYNMLKHIFRLLPGDILHPHQYDLNEYRDMLTDRNCKIEREVLVKPEGIFNYYLLVARRT